MDPVDSWIEILATPGNSDKYSTEYRLIVTCTEILPCNYLKRLLSTIHRIEGSTDEVALPSCRLSEVALIDEVARNIIGHDSYFVHFRFCCSRVLVTQ